MSWDCHVTNAENLTVGAPFVLSCSGADAGLSGQKVMITTQDGDAYTLKILEAQKLSPEGIDALVTSYRPLQVQDGVFLLTDGSKSVELRNISFSVKSVIQEQQQEPFPRFPPWVMSFPLWFWLSFAAVWLLLVAGIIWTFYRRSKNAKLMKEALAYRTSRPAIDEYFKELRGIEKKMEATDHGPNSLTAELEKILRLYLTRQFGIPAHAWPLQRTLQVIERHHTKLFRKEGLKIKSTLLEFAKIHGSKLSLQNVQQLVAMVSAMVSAVQAFENQTQRGGS